MRSIQSIIFIRLFGVILIFFCVVAAVAYFLTNEAMRQFVVSDSTTSLSFVINNVKNNYESDLKALDQISVMKGFLPFDEWRAHEVLKDFLEFPNIYNTVHMYRSDGPLLFAERRATMGPYNPKRNYLQKNPEFIELAQKVIAEKKSYASEVFYSPNKTLYQTYVTPVFQDGTKEKVFGILSGAVFPRLQRIDYLLHGLQLGQDNFILITDSSGRFITSDGITDKEAASSIQEHTDKATRHFFSEPIDVEQGDSAKSPIGTQTPLDPSRHAGHAHGEVVLKKVAFIDHSIKMGNYSYIVLSLPIDELRLLVTLGVNTHRIEAENKELSYRLLVALVLGLLMSLAASAVLGERLSKPFRQIADATNEINEGNFAARVTYKGDDEIGYLTTTINSMAEKIQKNEYLGNLWHTEVDTDALLPGAPNSAAGTDVDGTSPEGSDHPDTAGDDNSG